MHREFQGSKTPFAYTQMTVRLYPNSYSPIGKRKAQNFQGGTVPAQYRHSFYQT
jgi:hypothetical protein